MDNMEQDEKNIDLIEAFTKGLLSESDLADFERRRATDADFASEVADYLLIMKEIRTAEQRAFHHKLKGWENEIDGEKSKGKVIPMRRILSIAATLLIVALAGGYAIFKNLPVQGNDELFTKYFQPYDDVITERSTEESPLQLGMNLYNQEKYAMAIPYFETFLKEKPTEAAAQMYLGISYLADNKMGSAKDLFENLIRNDRGLYKEIAEWNMALIYLKSNETELLKKSLQQIIAQKDHPYADEAVSLSEEL
jgi:tetratricopeptide (TPR) repeat protein